MRSSKVCMQAARAMLKEKIAMYKKDLHKPAIIGVAIYIWRRLRRRWAEKAAAAEAARKAKAPAASAPVLATSASVPVPPRAKEHNSDPVTPLDAHSDKWFESSWRRGSRSRSSCFFDGFPVCQFDRSEAPSASEASLRTSVDTREDPEYAFFAVGPDARKETAHLGIDENGHETAPQRAAQLCLPRVARAAMVHPVLGMLEDGDSPRECPAACSRVATPRLPSAVPYQSLTLSNMMEELFY
eukprot:m51a1_g2608 hypothetical protein (242) ;mRNA; f:480425-488551